MVFQKYNSGRLLPLHPKYNKQRNLLLLSEQLFKFVDLRRDPFRTDGGQQLVHYYGRVRLRIFPLFQIVLHVVLPIDYGGGDHSRGFGAGGLQVQDPVQETDFKTWRGDDATRENHPRLALHAEAHSRRPHVGCCEERIRLCCMYKR